jgi:hypothetical protein
VKKNRYPLDELVKRWEREDLSVEQAIGQILLWLVYLLRQVVKLEVKQREAQKPKTS